MTKIFGFVALIFFADVSWAGLEGAYEASSEINSPDTLECYEAIKQSEQNYYQQKLRLEIYSGTRASQIVGEIQIQTTSQDAKTDQGMTSEMALVNGAAQKAVIGAAQTCREGCQRSVSSIEAKITEANSAGNVEESTRLEGEKAKAEKAGEACLAHYTTQAGLITAQAAISAEASVNALATTKALTMKGVSASDNPTWIEKAGKFVSNNWGKMAIGLGIGYMAKNRSDQKADEAKAKQMQAEAAKAAIPCTADNASENTKCTDYLKADCAKVVNLSTVRCKGFTATYCSSNDGIGTQLCKDSLARNYCDNASLASQRSNCYSCRDLNSRASADCTARPDLCMHENSMAEMAQWKATCPDDPVFTDPKWAGVTAGKSLTAAPTTTDAATNVALSRKPAEISPAFGPGLLSQTSNVIQQLCAGGHLNDCGSRAGITQ